MFYCFLCIDYIILNNVCQVFFLFGASHFLVLHPASIAITPQREVGYGVCSCKQEQFVNLWVLSWRVSHILSTPYLYYVFIISYFLMFVNTFFEVFWVSEQLLISLLLYYITTFLSICQELFLSVRPTVNLNICSLHIIL